MASRGINKVILVGNLGNDPEHRVLPSGGGVTNISLATSESWRDKNTGDQQERTEWHRVVFFNRLSEIAAEYLRRKISARLKSGAGTAPAACKAKKAGGMLHKAAAAAGRAARSH